MAQENPTNGAAPAEPRPSLREIAEQTYDDLVSGDSDGDAGPQDSPPVDEAGQPRDARGRFQPKPAGEEPGEADGQPPTQPRPEDTARQPPPPPHPAPPGSSSEVPANWDAAAKAAFAEQTPKGQEFLLRRHSEMEADYQRRVQANAVAAQFTSALAPVFQDPVMSGSLKQANLSPYDAISQWAQFHLRMVDPNMMVRYACWRELGERVGLNPAADGQQMSRPGTQQGIPLSEKDLADPAIRSFADHIGRNSTDVQQLRQELHQMRQQAAEQQKAEVVKVHRWAVDSFADEKDAQGNLKHPHFTAATPALVEMFRANPDLDLATAYEEALWRTPEIRAQLIAGEQQKREQAAANQRAQQAVRSNVRGITSPVSKPQAGPGERRGLRATIEAAADEIGY